MAPSSDLMLMMLADARLPVAGHTQSAGLEPAVAAGLTAGAVPDYIAARLATVTRVEAATSVVALQRIRAGGALEDVELAWAARTPSAALRRTSRTQARALLRLATRLWPEATEILTSGAGGMAPSRAVVLATVANACGLAPRQLARLIGYDDVQTVTSAALKLLPLDPAIATTWAFEALAHAEAMAEEVSSLTDPHQIPASGAPQFEAWAEAHAVADRRLFSA